MERMNRSDEGILSVVDALFFAITLMVISLFFFHIYTTSLAMVDDLTLSEVEHDMVMEIHESVFHSTIRETYYINQTQGNKKERYENISVEDSIKNYLYLSYIENNTADCSYDLFQLKKNITDKYTLASWQIAHYHYAVYSEYKGTVFFISDECDDIENMPNERSADIQTSTMGQDKPERINIILYIWM